MNKPINSTVNTLKIHTRNDGKLEINASFSDGCAYMEVVKESVSDEQLARALVRWGPLSLYAKESWEITFFDDMPRTYSGRDLVFASAMLLSYILSRNSDTDDYYC